MSECAECQKKTITVGSPTESMQFSQQAEVFKLFEDITELCLILFPLFKYCKLH